MPRCRDRTAWRAPAGRRRHDQLGEVVVGRRSPRHHDDGAVTVQFGPPGGFGQRLHRQYEDVLLERLLGPLGR
ncbi:hypothetical protein ACVDFE_21510 [Lentzea chajnantorensis]